MRSARLVGIGLSLLLAGAVWFAPLPGELSQAGRATLAVTLFTVVWWIFNVTPPAYATLLMLLAYILLGLAPILVEVTWWRIVGLL